MASITDIAREAGCSISTVSYALSGKRTVNPTTRKRILNACERLGYVPNAAARGLRPHCAAGRSPTPRGPAGKSPARRCGTSHLRCLGGLRFEGSTSSLDTTLDIGRPDRRIRFALAVVLWSSPSLRPQARLASRSPASRSC